MLTTWPDRRALLRSCLLGLGALLLLVWTIVPLYWLFVRSVVTPAERTNPPPHALFPRAPTFEGYRAMLGVRLLPAEGGLIGPTELNDIQLEGWRNSVLVALAVVPLTLAIAVPGAYAFGRLRFRHRNRLLLTVVLTRAYPPIAAAIPFNFMFLRLGIDGTLPAIVLAHLTLTIPLVTWIMTGFFAGLPRSVEWAARVDGLSRLGVIRHVIPPLALPGVAACAVIAFLTSWTEFFFAQAIMSSTLSGNTIPMTVKVSPPAYLVLSLLPVLALALALQRTIRAMRIAGPL